MRVEAGNIGGMMITGSHLKPDQNGFKLSIGKDNLYGEQIQALRQMIERGELAEGHGQVQTDDSVRERYLAMATEKLGRERSLKIVVDAGNGMGGVFGVPLLEALGHQVTCLYCEPDGSYPNHQPRSAGARQPARPVRAGQAGRRRPGAGVRRGRGPCRRGG